MYLDTVSFTPIKQPVTVKALLGPLVNNQPFNVTRGLLAGKQWKMFHVQGESVDEHIVRFEDQGLSHLKVNRDQSVVVLAEEDYVHWAKVVYDPPIMVIPADLVHHQPQVMTSKMTVYSLRTKAQRDKGTCTVRVEVLGKQRLHLSGRVYHAIVIKTTRELKLGLAQGTVTIYDYYAPSVGLVAYRIERKLITMGFIPMNSVIEVQRAQ
ncbi:MAG: hypothetical protein JKX85_07585 [Phycisphaeraceae bacterium]|nr:hypothetical protein [Phycisphaeraceae bacterium]